MIKNITVLGVGTMGSEIAHFFAQNGLYVTAYDPNPEALSVAQIKLRKNTKKIRIPQAGRINSIEWKKEYIKYTIDLEESIRQADFIIESAPEDLEIKRRLYNNISPFLKKKAIVASNTSTFQLATLAYKQAFASRMLITHFFNPAHLIPPVEIVRTEQTISDLADKVAGFLSNCGKKPVVLKKDISGFIANRLQAVVLREAYFLLENDVADARQIDTVMKAGLGIRWVLNDPFEIADFGGLDIWKKVLNNVLPILNNAQQAPDIIRKKVERNDLGLKTGKGFF